MKIEELYKINMVSLLDAYIYQLASKDDTITRMTSERDTARDVVFNAYKSGMISLADYEKIRESICIRYSNYEYFVLSLEKNREKKIKNWT